MRAIFRVFAAVFLALSMVLLVADGTAMLAANAFIATPLAVTISNFFPGTVEAMQTGLAANVHPLLWQTPLAALVSWPGWAVIGVLGLLLALIGRSRSRRRMVSIDTL